MRNKFNILILSSEFPPLPGGIGNHALHLALSLQNEGKEVAVITDQRSKKIDDDIVFDNQLPIKVQRIKRHSMVLFTYLSRIFQTIKTVNTNKKITLISSGKFSLWLGAFMKFLFSRSKCVAVLHGSEIYAGGKLSKHITKWSLSQFDSLVAVSEFTKNLALETNPNLKITVINNGFAFPEIENNNSDFVKGNPNIVTVGNVSYRKGQQNVINALPILKEKYPEIQYHIIGIPTEKDTFEALAKSLHVHENVIFHGAMSNHDLKQVVSSSKVFFMLSDHLKNGDVEGFGIAVLEANFLGLPAIGSKNSGITDAIKEGYSGKLVNPHDAIEIASAFDEIMNNYNHYSTESKQWSKHFDWDIIIKKYLEIID
ncbi:glycosyltransferase family 4 protein [Flavobacterium sp.]|uniref:glycosyltransferase family 4 protein n=1 Tax=Flavobacterium sp. TaxID=239 RepID=UPI0038FC9597